MYAVLLRNCDKTIQEIGDINLSDTGRSGPVTLGPACS